MKKTIIALTLCGIAAWTGTQAMAQKKTVAKTVVQGFIIAGTVKNETDEKVYLEYEENGKKIKDSTQIKNGVFKFKGKVEEPVYSVIRTNGGKTYLGMFLENTPITVTIDTAAKIIAVAGSKEDSIYREWESKWFIVTKKAGVIYKKIDEAYKGLEKDAKLDPKIRKGFDDEFSLLDTETDSTVFPIVKQYPNSYASAFIILCRYVDWNKPEIAAKSYALLSDKIKKSDYGRKISTYIELDAKTGIGRTAIDFTMNDISGKPIKLSDLRGQYVLVDFWASWCGPCRKENPNVLAAYAKYHVKGMEILAVSLDSKMELWEKAVKNDKLPWIHVSDLKGFENEAAILYGVKIVPSNYLLDPNGVIVARNLRGEDLEKKLAEIFKQN